MSATTNDWESFDWEKFADSNDSDGTNQSATAANSTSSSAIAGETTGDDANVEFREELRKLLAEYEQRQTEKTELRRRNAEAVQRRPDESFFSKLDSNLKKNTNFVKKLKTFSESQRDTIVRDFESLNLSRYVAEIAANLCEAKLKMSDVSTMVEFCSLMHRRYSDFASPCFLSSFQKSFPVVGKQKLNIDSEKASVSNPSKLRVDLRLLAELIIVGVLPEKEALSVLGGSLKFLTVTDERLGDYCNLPLILTFLKFCGEDYVGLVPKRLRLLCERTRTPVERFHSTLVSPERQRAVRLLLTSYYRSLVDKHLPKMRKDWRQLELQNRRQYESKGEIHPEAQQRQEEAKQVFEKLLQNAVQFAELMDIDEPNLPLEQPEEQESGGGDSGSVVGGGIFEKIDAPGGLWEDEDTRIFYETLPELKLMLPGILFKESEQPTLAPLEEKINELPIDEAELSAPPVADVSEKMDISEESSIGADVAVADDEAQQLAMEPDEHADAPADDSRAQGGSSLKKQMMDAFLMQLPNTINRDLIDQAAINFVTNLNTKGNRKRLVKTLFAVPRNRSDLLPFYSRLVAVLKPVMPDVSTELVQMLINDFRYQLRKKEPMYIETKIKIMRFIGELVKFKAFPKSEALHCLKMLLYDFRHHHIEMACALLEICGRYLYFSSDSHQKTKILLEQIDRKRKAAAYMDQRYHLMIDNALTNCKPDISAVQKTRIELPPWQSYMQKLIFSDLSKTTVEKILKQLRKFNWEDKTVMFVGIKYLSQPWHLKYNCVQWLASLLAGMTYYYDSLGYTVVDNVLEEMRIGMEINNQKFNQRRLCVAKYLAEMYNYRVVDSAIIFSTLYALITFGVTYDVNVPNFNDPPEHLFRIRLICAILETCGEYFDRGLAKKKLDCFLTYFQRYYLWKKTATFWTPTYPFPLEISNIVQETLEFLRPRLKLFQTYDEAVNAVKTMEDEYRQKAELALKFVPSGDDKQSEEIEDERGPLRSVPEEDEDGSDSEVAQRPSQSQESGGGASQPFDGHRSASQGGADDWRGRSIDRDTDDEGHLNDISDSELHVRRTAVGQVRDAADEEFTAAFDRFMNETIQQRLQESSKPAPQEIPIPHNVKTKLAAKTHFADDMGLAIEKKPTPAAKSGGDHVNFVFLTKTRNAGGKINLKTLKVPADSDLARTMKSREEEEQLEKERMKQLTLDISRRMQQEEEYAELTELQKKVASNLAPRPYQQMPAQNQIQQQQQQQQQQQRGRWQHQRGAPGPHEAFSRSWDKR